MEEALAVFLALSLGMLLLVGIFAIIAYVINALFLSRIAKDINLGNRWMAWVPVANSFYMGNVAGTISNDSSFTTKYYIAIIGTFVSTFLSSLLANQDGAIMAIMALVFLAFDIMLLVLNVMAFYRIFKAYDPSNAVIFTILQFIPVVSFIVIVYFTFSKVGKGAIYVDTPVNTTDTPDNNDYL